MSKPSILFFPGSYCLLSLYQPLFDAVTEAGYEIKGIHPPTVGPSSRQGYAYAAPSIYDDAAVLAQEVETLADEGKDVIIIGHSYGGVPMTQASKGLGKEERRALSKPGGIVRLGYMSAIVPAHGQSAREAISVVPAEQHPPIDVDVSPRSPLFLSGEFAGSFFSFSDFITCRLGGSFAHILTYFVGTRLDDDGGPCRDC